MGYEIQGKDTRCAKCEMKIRSQDDGVMFSLAKDSQQLPFHKKCLLPLLNELSERSHIPLESLVNDVPKAVVVDGI